MSDYSPLWNIYVSFGSIYPLFYQGPVLQINQLDLQVFLEYLLGLFGTCKSYIQTFSGLRFYLQTHFLFQQCCPRRGMWNSDHFSFSLSCLGIPTVYGYTSSTSWQLLRESTQCMPWTLLCPCLQLSQVPAWALLPVEWLSAHGVMAGCTLKLHSGCNDTQKGLNGFSIHQLQYNLSFLESVIPRVAVFSTSFLS